jgi:DNA invertase Pin-like site-specific DNA recombinase
MKRIAIYARVSTKQHGQTVDTQLLPLRQYCEARGLEIFAEYCDTGVSGSKDRRPQLDKLMKDAKARKFDGVLVWKFDRFGRSVSHLIKALEEFRSLGVEFISLTEAVDTSTPTGKLMFSMLSAFSEFERSLTIERIHSGLDRARSQGKTLGRREVVVSKDRIAEYRSQGKSYDFISKQLGVSVGKVYAIVNAA